VCRVLSVSSLALALTLAAWAARASEEDDKRVCLSTYVEAQSTRQEGKLGASQRALEKCGAQVCPGVIRNDCVRWLREVTDAMPTVVLSATGSDGRDVADVRVSIDGQPLASHLDGGRCPWTPENTSFDSTSPQPARSSNVSSSVKERRTEPSLVRFREAEQRPRRRQPPRRPRARYPRACGCSEASAPRRSSYRPRSQASGGLERLAGAPANRAGRAVPRATSIPSSNTSWSPTSRAASPSCRSAPQRTCSLRDRCRRPPSRSPSDRTTSAWTTRETSDRCTKPREPTLPSKPRGRAATSPGRGGRRRVSRSSSGPPGSNNPSSCTSRLTPRSRRPSRRWSRSSRSCSYT
jgi:hypothetical protein